MKYVQEHVCAERHTSAERTYVKLGFAFKNLFLDSLPYVNDPCVWIVYAQDIIIVGEKKNYREIFF